MFKNDSIEEPKISMFSGAKSFSAPLNFINFHYQFIFRSLRLIILKEFPIDLIKASGYVIRLVSSVAFICS